jgi:hypothetical protein
MIHEKREAIQQEEMLSPDVVAFCALIARIMMRCLAQQDVHRRKFLSLPSQTEGRGTGGKDGPTV